MTYNEFKVGNGGPAKDNNNLNQEVYNVSNVENPSNYTQMLGEMAERYKQTPQTLEDLMNRIAFHESAGGNPTLHQYGGGPGRGLFQFEAGEAQGGATAMNRLQRYFGENAPDWTQYDSSEGVDAAKLSPEQQKMLFMANLRYHPEASLTGVTPENLGESFWAPYHWAGDAADKPARLRSFDESMGAYDLHNKPTAEERAFME